MTDRVQQWLLQADYDLGTADAMFDTGRYIYAVFMAHLAIEKTLKARYQQVHNEVPPKTHNLMYLLAKNGDELPESMRLPLSMFNEAHIVTRYPEDMVALQKKFNQQLTAELLGTAKEIQTWIKQKCLT